ncbi:hypothetical protein A9P82_10060 [Arachidicoccus ginsenosidimutans]|uniref:RNA polymerase sigma factor n=1 Tax=Arachidicoccus sp. BS20 TaxID=1850526 RepID=UPI0007F06067|nr:sigma-70 family RNA polymerase sigma factor [Arachidicoccus sp. BS20]ANI89602.1 hypothetical protein A9P82_10060 [Arachidicoccus sp. BS20]
MSIFSNRELIEKLKKNDEAVFAYLYKKYHNAVYANIRKLVNDETNAEDILQDVFLLLWSRREKLTSEQEIGGWLFSASYYKSLEFLKKSIKQSLAVFDEAKHDMIPVEEGTSEAAYEEKLTILNAGIELLSPQKKSAFTLCRIYGKSYEEAADQMGVSAETVRGYVKDSAKFLKHYVLKESTSLSIFAIFLFARFLGV